MKQVLNRKIKTIIMLLVLQYATACATLPDPDYAPVPPAQMVQHSLSNGSIYQSGQGVALFEDHKARTVGDTLTIVLIESTDASKQNNTSTSKENEVDLANPTLFGSDVEFDIDGSTMNRIRGGFPVQSRTGNNLEMGLNSSSSFDGSGTSQQSNSLNGSVTVTVSEVLPNGNLLVRGEKIITLNQSNEYVRIKGIVRPADIDANNSVPSTKVAHAQITYGGTGAIADASKHGWLSRALLKVWPF